MAQPGALVGTATPEAIDHVVRTLKEVRNPKYFGRNAAALRDCEEGNLIIKFIE